MRTYLLLSLILATILSTNLNAKNMYDRIQSMEAQMRSLQKEITTLKEANEKVLEAATKVDEEAAAQEVQEATPDNVSSIKDVLAAKEEDDDAEDAEDANVSEEDDSDEESADDEDEFEDETSIADLEESISELNRATGGNHLKFQVDYRFATDNIHYKMADGSTAKNDALLTNRLWLNMGYKATNNLTFKGQLAYYKAFGARTGIASTARMEDFDWIASENPYNDTLRVRQAYFLWQNRTFLGAQIPWTFSIGRRPSTNGHLINFRDDNHASSPLAHGINVEFDGLSSKFTVIPSLGTSIKFCLGRGMSNAKAKFSSTPYATNKTTNPAIDLAGLIFVLYDDKQYSLNTMYYFANNLIDANSNNSGFDTVGGMHSGTANITMKGIGDEWSDFLDETIFFISGAFSKTVPNNKTNSLGTKGMLGSTHSKVGYSYWVGTQFPSLLTEDGRWGVEYNHGSKYWRAITYGEDTLAGSKIAARGNAYEAYFTEYLVEDILSMQLRYTYIDYQYSGSNGFFGNTTGTPMTMAEAKAKGYGSQIANKAQDIRFYIRYRF